MSNASSPASSFMESVPSSLRNEFLHHGSSSTLDSPNAYGTHLEGHSNGTPDGEDASGNAGPESMFNFQSLAAMIGKDDKEDKEDIARHVEHLIGHDNGQASKPEIREDSSSTGMEESVATLKVDHGRISENIGNGGAKHRAFLDPQRTTPEVMITPETPAAVSHDQDGGKQLGAGWTEGVTREITQ